MKKFLKILACILAVVILIVGGYLIYVFADYYRLDDNLTLDVENNQSDTAKTGEEYTIVSWNLGFGAYSADYSFFMDGGDESRARSEQAVYDNIGSALDRLTELSPDFCFLEEIDTDSTRSYHVNEETLVQEALPDYGSVFAQNYDSPYLFYPLTEPHGASKAGQMTLSRFAMTDSLRRSLPIEGGFMKLLDLDRCYSITRVPLDNGKDLVLVCLHLSAYTSDGTIADDQIDMLVADLQAEYEAGNYVVCGGDFNKDLLGNSSEIFGVSGEEFTWAQPFPTDKLTDDLTLIAPLDAENPVPSCRNADSAYTPGESFVITVDGFIVSDNVTVVSSEVVDTGFAWSDHNPVQMTFILE
jgi:endonuclease/exonuclease/phosphatase family metal-dependent hydrolase